MNNFSKLLMSSVLCAVCTVASAQQVNVKGIVKDATGETVIGASVMVKGTKTVLLPTLMVTSTLNVRQVLHLLYLI